MRVKVPMKIEDFNIELIRVRNIFPLQNDAPDPKQVIETNAIKVRETGQMYIDTYGSRTRKADLLKLTKPLHNTLPEFEVYCLPGDVDKAVALIMDRLNTEITKIHTHVSGILAAIQAGSELISYDQRIQNLIEKSKKS